MVYVYHSFLIHSSADGHLGCFHVLAMINSAAMNIGVHVSLSDLVSLVSMPSSEIAGSYGSSISSFIFVFIFVILGGGSKINLAEKLLYSVWNSAHCYAAAGMAGEFGGQWIHVYVWLSSFAVHLKLS